MRRFQLGLAMFALPVFAATLFLAGCGGGKDEKKSEGSGGGDKGQASSGDSGTPAGEMKVLKPGNGVLKGIITLKGAKPDREARDKELHAEIEKNASQKDYCLKGSESETSYQALRVGKNNQVGNVVVWIKPEKNSFFEVTDKEIEEAKKDPVVIRQPHCAFIPHVAVLFSKYHPDAKKPKEEKSTGQVLIIKNDAEVSHNTNYNGGLKNPGGNPTLEKKSEQKVENLVPANEPVRFKCNIHGWMDAYLWVVDTPYHAVSLSDNLDGSNKVKEDDPKFGSYEIKNLPAGKVRIVAWHEKGDFLNKGGIAGETIEIKDGPNEKDFTMEAK
jgi:hypothetical protein